MTSSRLPVVGLVAALTLAALAGCGKPPPKSVIDVPAEYVAIGDSYTAVSGINAGVDGCFRSEDDYPALVARARSIKGKAFENASCGGATSANLVDAQEVALTKTTNPPQLTRVTKDTKLVTIGIGGNDYFLASFVIPTPCAAADATPVECDAAILQQPIATTDLTIRNMGLLVGRDIAEVRKKAPHARVVLVGYPRMLPPTGTCPAQIPASEAALDRIRFAQDEINKALKAAASLGGAGFVDMGEASVGHDMCSADPWVNGKNQTQAFPFHPFPAYHEAVAAKIVALLEK